MSYKNFLLTCERGDMCGERAKEPRARPRAEAPTAPKVLIPEGQVEEKAMYTVHCLLARNKTNNRSTMCSGSACQKSLFDKLSIHAGRGSSGDLHRAARTPKAHTCPIKVRKIRHMSCFFAYFDFISPPAGRETLRGCHNWELPQYRKL